MSPNLLRIASIVAVVAVAAVPLGIVYATQGPGAHAASGDGLVVKTSHDSFRAGDTVRIFLENAGSGTLSGSPRVLIIDENGNVLRTFVPGDFKISLSPGESVWVDWPTVAPPVPTPCGYGIDDSSGAPKMGASYPCPMMGTMQDSDPPRTVQDQGNASRVGSDCADCTQPGPAGMPVCYGCWHASSEGDYVIVGMFGRLADATVIHVAQPGA